MEPQRAEGLPFAKMHGCRNDYVVVDGFRHAVPEPAALARAVADRRRGVGCDGLLLALPCEEADLRMRMFNPDGSEAESCGNGLRCLALFALRRGLVRGTDRLTLATPAGIVPARVEGRVGPGTGRAAADVEVDLGVPGLERAAIPMRGPSGRVVAEPLDLDGTRVEVTAVSLGNPHAVLFVDDVEAAAVATVGPRLECDAAFPERTNVEFVQVLGPGEVRQRTWERGAGETLACGTGACAVVVAGALTGRTQRRATVHLRGGDLQVEWAQDGHVRLRGPAEVVFEGTWWPEAIS